MRIPLHDCWQITTLLKPHAQLFLWGGGRSWDFGAIMSDMYWTCQTHHKIIKSNHLKIIKLYKIWSNHFGWWVPHLKPCRNLKLFWKNYFGTWPHPQNNYLIRPPSKTSSITMWFIQGRLQSDSELKSRWYCHTYSTDLKVSEHACWELWGLKTSLADL